MSPARPFVDALGDELYAAAVRRMSPAAIARRRRRRLAPVGASVAVLAVLLGTLLAIARPNTAQAEVRVERVDDRVVVTLVDLEHRPEHLEAVIREAGLDVSVVSVPVGPSAVGRFVGTLSSQLPAELRVTEGAPTTFTGFSVPVGWSGSLDLQVGRPARDGETYAAFSDAFAPEEPLACTALLGRPATDALAVLAARHLDGAFLATRPEPAGTQVVAAADLPTTDVSRWVIVAADATSADHVLLRVESAPPPIPGVSDGGRC